MKIKAAVAYEFGKPVVIDELDLADPRHGEVMVKLSASGICGTDSGLRKDGFGGMDKTPIAIGHEGAGYVEKVGPGVTDFKVGDAVIVSYPTCGHCKNCKRGKSYACEEVLPLIHNGTFEDGFTPLSKDGKPVNLFFGASTVATYCVTNVRNLAKIDLPEGEDIADYAGLACGLMTGAGTVMNWMRPYPGDSIVVFGAGAIGLSAIAGARISRCNPIICIDINNERLELSKEFGATHTINPKDVSSLKDEVMKYTGGKGADFVVEGTGHCAPLMPEVAAAVCKMALVTVTTEMTLHNANFDLLGKDLHSINMGDADPSQLIPVLAKCHQDGLFPFEKMNTYYTLDQVNQAMDDYDSHKVIKPVIRF